MIISLVSLIYVVIFTDRVNTSIAAQDIMPEYGLSDVQFGWIFSAFILGYALAQIPGGWLGDRFGPRKVITWAISAARFPLR
ncbi:MAG: MFS transporter [Proteobacteria bacterium]|nr:MAG: MFS transporter [Pseudomonadota bacterium]